MSTSAQVPGGIVSHLQGRADVIPVGEIQARPLQPGDTIQTGDVILAANDTQIHVRDGAGQDWLPSDRAMAMAGGPSGKSAGKAKPQALRLDEDGPTLEEAIQALDEGRDDALPAAGLGGGGGGAMTPGLRADRVIETVSPLEFNYDTAVRSEGSPFTPV